VEERERREGEREEKGRKRKDRIEGKKGKKIIHNRISRATIPADRQRRHFPLLLNSTLSSTLYTSILGGWRERKRETGKREDVGTRWHILLTLSEGRNHFGPRRGGCGQQRKSPQSKSAAPPTVTKSKSIPKSKLAAALNLEVTATGKKGFTVLIVACP